MSEFSRQREFWLLDDAVEAIGRDPAIGYVCRTDEAVMAFGDAFLGDTGMLYARQTAHGVDMQKVIFYHNQEPAIVAWLLATVAQGMSEEERVALHDELMAQLESAEAEVRPPAYHHESFGVQYQGEASARSLRLACADPSLHPMTYWWQDAATMDASRPAIRTDALANSRQIRIVDEFEERSFVLPYADAVTMAIGLTVYDRGRIRPDVIKQVYDGLLPA